MEIIFDYDFNDAGRIVAHHLIDTTPGNYPKIQVPVLGVDPVDVIHYINALLKGKMDIQGTGWEEITKHYRYPQQTRFNALIGEIIRRDDKSSRAVLGV